MNYEQKYKEALARARVVNPGTEDYNIVTAIFPELKESEDERISKEIIHYLDREITLSNFGGDIATFKRWIAWLEKQGEQLYIRFGEISTDEKSKIYQGEIEVGTENGVSVYPAFKTDEGDIVLGLNLPITKTTLYTQQHLIEYDDRPCYLVKGDYIGKDTDGQLLINNINIVEKIDSYRVKEEKQGNPTEKVEPKFKVGDWIVGNYVHIISKVVNIKQLSDGTYGYDLDNSCGCYFASFEEEYHLWSIKDAEKGDILQANKCTLIFDSLTKDIDGNTVISSWYYCNTKTFYGIGTCKPDLWAIEGVTPATEEQCDFLFAKMKNAGCRWDAKEKKLIKL